MKTQRICSMLLVLLLMLSLSAFSPSFTQPVHAAKAKKARVSVNFNAQGGSTVKSKLVTAGKAIGAVKTPKNKGFAFKGWYTKPVGGKKINKNTKPANDMTYYAQWKIKKGLVQAVFKTNGYNIYKAYKKNAKLGAFAVKKLVLKGHTFMGWYSKATNGTLATKATRIKKNTIYRAAWLHKQYTLSFNPNGGSVYVASKEITFGQAYGALPFPERSGYSFSGWYSGVMSGSKVTARTITVAAGDITVYARWKKTNYTPDGDTDDEVTKDSDDKFTHDKDGKISQSITVSLSDSILIAGRQYSLNVSGQGPIQYRSANPDIVSVNETGVITALKPGYATVFAEVMADDKYNYASGFISLTVAGGDKQQYSYELYLMNEHDIYAAMGSANALIYIKTDNPDPSRILLTGNTSTQQNANFFDDVKYTGNDHYCLSSVEGGYITCIQPSKPGRAKVTIWEAYEGYDEYDIWYPRANGRYEYSKLFGCETSTSIEFDALDRDVTHDAWIDDLISQNTTAAMTFHEKMRSIEAYILENYKYPANNIGYEENEQLLQLVGNYGAHWDVKKLDSASSPILLMNIAYKLGCTDMERLKGDMHAYVYLTYDGDKQLYCACPWPADNSFDPDTLPYFDFSVF